jgi:hypothetical protein
MADAPHLTSQTDNTAVTAPLSDAQVGNAVATKFLTEVHDAMTVKPSDGTYITPMMAAGDDLNALNGDPQEKAVVNAIAGKIEAHDPSLGVVQGTVDRDKDGNITGFTFSNPERQSEYQTTLNNYEAQGYTQQEAIAAQNNNFITTPAFTGTWHMDAPSDKPLPPAANNAPTPVNADGEYTIGG